MENKLSYWAAPSGYVKENTMEEMVIINNKLIDKVCSLYDVTLMDLKGNSHKGEIVEARQVLFYIFRNKFKYAFTKIGDIFNKNHATVLHGVKKINGYIEYDKDLKYRINKLYNYSIYLVKGDEIKVFSKKSSIYKGVSWHKSTNRWRAVIRINGKQKHLGTFLNDRDAHLAFEKANEELKKQLKIN